MDPRLEAAELPPPEVRVAGRVVLVPCAARAHVAQVDAVLGRSHVPVGVLQL